MSSRRSGLGRGLEALIPPGSAAAPEEATEGPAFTVIPIDAVRPNPHQPRSTFDPDALASLAASIAEVGVLQPVVVRKDEVGYVLVAGERRWRAAKQAGLDRIPAIVREGDDAAWLTEALIENVQRENLSPLEEAAAYRQLLDDFGLTHEQIAQRVGKSRTTVTNTLRLLALPAEIQGMLERGEITAGHARALLGSDDEAFAVHVARRAVAEGWSVRQVEEAVRARKGASEDRSGAEDRAPRVHEVRPAAIIELEHRLEDRLGVPVKIDFRGGEKGGKGTIAIRYGSLDDLERIYRALLGR